MRRIPIALIHFYRYFLSPWIGQQCRFYPSCSHYAEEAIERYGTLKGGCLTLLRLGKCHPWHPGGLDPVPQPCDYKKAGGYNKPGNHKEPGGHKKPVDHKRPGVCKNPRDFNECGDSLESGVN